MAGIEWTSTEDATLFAAVQSGKMLRDTKKPGRTYSSVQSRATRLQFHSHTKAQSSKRRAMRPCRRCQRPMLSEHFGHRICGICHEVIDGLAV